MSKELDLKKSTHVFQKFVIKSIADWNSKHNTNFYCPIDTEIEEAFQSGFYAMTKYGCNYGIDTLKVDIIKLFSFSSLYFDTDLMAIEKGEVFSTQPLWYGILITASMIHNADKEISALKDIANTCSILHRISYNRIAPNRLAAYCYVKGIEETMVFLKQKT